jgi:hypothetical protein
MGGLPQLGQKEMSGLKTALASQSAPPNPQTPTDRTDPSDAVLLDFQRVRRALDKTKDGLPEADPRGVLVGAMHSCVTRLLTRVQTSDAVDILLERAFPLSSPELRSKLAQMFAPPPPLSPPTGLGGGAQPPGMPPMANQAPAGATGLSPGGPPPGGPPGDAGVESALPA